MAEQLYALQRDLNMITEDVQNLKRSYNIIDGIGKKFDNLWHEQLAQGAGMRRLEERLDKAEVRLDKAEARLEKIETRLEKIEARLDNIEVRLDKMEVRLDNIEVRLDKMEKILIKICFKLKIKLDV